MTDAQTTLSGANTPVWEFIAPNVTTGTLLRFQLNVTNNLGQVGTALVNVLDNPPNTLLTTQAKLYMVKITSPIKGQKNTSKQQIHGIWDIRC
jgi:hypothetical protein